MKQLHRIFAISVLITLSLSVVACNFGSAETESNKQTEAESGNEIDTSADSEPDTDSRFEPESDGSSDADSGTADDSESDTDDTKDSDTESDSESESDSEKETDGKSAYADLVDFIVTVPEDREPVILQLTDTQIIDATQEREGDPTFGSTMKAFWGPDSLEDRCFKQLRETINATKPDLILLTGDIVYGRWDDNGSCFLALVEFMESFGIPWAPVFGNHDNECALGVDWQCEQLEKAENCLFLQRTLTGNGNYTVGIEQGGKLKRVFYMLDSNGCGLASDASMSNGHTQKGVGFGSDQLSWCKKTMKAIKEASPETKISYAFHIQLSIFSKAFDKYGYVQGGDRINIDKLSEKNEGDLGYIGAGIKSGWNTDNSVWNMLVKYEVDSIFVGHEHSNSSSIVYEGVRMQYGQKSSEYDRYNFVDKYGEITTAQIDNSKTSLVGGTVFTLAEDGSINTPRIYYYGFENGEIDWENDFEKPIDVPVNGLQFGTDMYLASSSTVTAEVVWVDDTQTSTAYMFTASYQGKVYVNPELIKNKSTLTFSLYVPSTSTGKFAGSAEFAIRTKPDDIEPGDDGVHAGHIMYRSNSTKEEYKLFFDEWLTYTVDISEFGEKCTEFAFYVPTGNTIYMKDIVIADKEVDENESSTELESGSENEQETEDLPEEEPVISGLQYGTDLSLTSGSSTSSLQVEPVWFDSTTAAYKLYASYQAKLYVNTELVKNKSTLTFSLYVPSTSTGKFAESAEFAIRTKPDDIEPGDDGVHAGHIMYRSNSTKEEYKLFFDEWLTYTVDISEFGDSCTEFAFYVPTGNTVYIKDIIIE